MGLFDSCSPHLMCPLQREDYGLDRRKDTIKHISQNMLDQVEFTFLRFFTFNTDAAEGPQRYEPYPNLISIPREILDCYSVLSLH